MYWCLLSAAPLTLDCLSLPLTCCQTSYFPWHCLCCGLHAPLFSCCNSQLYRFQLLCSESRMPRWDYFPDVAHVIPSTESPAPFFGYHLYWTPFIIRHNAKLASSLPKLPVIKVLQIYPLFFVSVYKRFFNCPCFQQSWLILKANQIQDFFPVIKGTRGRWQAQAVAWWSPGLSIFWAKFGKCQAEWDGMNWRIQSRLLKEGQGIKDQTPASMTKTLVIAAL